MNFESELAGVVLERLNDHEAETIERLRAAGYKVTKPKAPKAKAEQPTLNAVGKPYSPLFNPNYKVKHKTSTAHLFKPYPYAMRWVKEGKPGHV